MDLEVKDSQSNGEKPNEENETHEINKDSKLNSREKEHSENNQNKISAAEYELNDRKVEYNEQNSFDDPSAVNRTNTGAASTKKAKFNYTMTTTLGQSQSQPYLNYGSTLVENLKSVGQAKNKRNEIEKDVELLHNRIKMLQMEELRAMKKIEETRKKADRIMEIRKINDKKYEQKLKEQMKNERKLKKRKNEKYTEEKERKDNIDFKITSIKKTKRSEAILIKTCGKDNDERKRRFREQIKILNERK